MKKVRVYNLGDYMKNQTGKQIHEYEKIVILVGDNGVVVRDCNGWGWDENIITDSIPVELKDYGCNTPIPPYKVFIPLEDIMDNANYEEVLLNVFMAKAIRARYEGTIQSMRRSNIEVELYVDEPVPLKEF